MIYVCLRCRTWYSEKRKTCIACLGVDLLVSTDELVTENTRLRAVLNAARKLRGAPAFGEAYNSAESELYAAIDALDKP